MKMAIASLSCALALLAGAGAARSADLDVLNGKLRKYTAPFRGLCVCQDGSVHHRRVGYIASFPLNASPGVVEITSDCVVYQYTAEGITSGATGCRPYVALAK